MPGQAPYGAAGVLSPISRDGRRTRTSDLVHDELVSAIRTLRLAPGSSLSETEIAERLHVSRTPGARGRRAARGRGAPDVGRLRALLDQQEASCRALISRHARRALDRVPALCAQYPDYFTDPPSGARRPTEGNDPR
jgi:hypothetical protein